MSLACRPTFAVAHVAVNLAFGSEGRHRVNHEHVDGRGAYELFGYLEGLFAVVGLGDVETVDVHAEFFGVESVEGMFGVDYRCDATGLLRFGNGVDGESGFTG